MRDIAMYLMKRFIHCNHLPGHAGHSRNLETPFWRLSVTERIHDYRGCEAGHEITKAGAAQFTDPISDTRNNREGALANE